MVNKVKIPIVINSKIPLFLHRARESEMRVFEKVGQTGLVKMLYAVV